MSRALFLAALASMVLAPPVQGQDLDRISGPRGIGPDSHGLYRVDQLGRVLSRTDGIVAIPIVLGLFADSDEPAISRDDVQASLFDGPSARGTVTESYLEMSRGVIEVGGDVFPWVRTDVAIDSAVGTSWGLGGDAQAGAYFVQALAGADVAADFSRYDNDGPDGLPNSGDDDGYVDIIAFEFLEIAASCGGPAIWPHKWRLSAWSQDGAFETGDVSAQDSVPFIKVDEYITQSVADCSGSVVQDASVIAHEFGHVLGLPDFYHPTVSGAGAEGRRWVLGCWALMAGGSWGCGPVVGREPFGPVHLSAYSKSWLGWLDYTDVGDVRNQEFLLDPVQTSGDVLRIPLGDTGTEFLIAEYRGLLGFDSELPAAGVIMYKQDIDGRLRPDTASADPYFLRLLEQDDNNGLVRNSFQGGNRGEAGDAWGVAGVVNELHAETSPSLTLSNGGATSVTVHEVSVVGGQARLVISTASDPEIVPPTGPLEVTPIEPFTRSVRIAGGSMPYSFVGTLPAGVSARLDGDDLILEGSIRDPGSAPLTLVVRDSRGTRSPDVAASITTVGEWVVSLVELLQPLLQSADPPLAGAEADYLDAVGNGNGRYDVGDLRRWLREAG